jgi:hypothetical protein
VTKFKQKRKPKRDPNRLPRIVAIVLVFGLIAAFFIGSIGTLSARAAGLSERGLLGQFL